MGRLIKKSPLSNNIFNLEAVNFVNDYKGPKGEYTVTVYDYNGDILDEVKLNEGDIYTLPENPTHHKNLVFQEWAATEEIIDNTISVRNRDVIIGAVYTTASGLDEFDIEITKASDHYVRFGVPGEKDWGDGTVDTSTTHTYESEGTYTIKCFFGAYSGGSGENIFGNGRDYVLREVRLSDGITTIPPSTFFNCVSLKSISIPKSVESIREEAFTWAVSLEHLFLPSVTDFGDDRRGSLYGTEGLKNLFILSTISSTITAGSYDRATFGDCYSLKNLYFPAISSPPSDELFNDAFSLENLYISDNVEELRDRNFYKCINLKNIVFPESLRDIGTECFSYCNGLTKVKFPMNIESLGDYIFDGCYRILEIDFSESIRIPSISEDTFNTRSGRLNSLCKIYVPDNLYDEWVNTPRWVTYAGYIYKASEKVI